MDAPLEQPETSFPGLIVAQSTFAVEQVIGGRARAPERGRSLAIVVEEDRMLKAARYGAIPSRLGVRRFAGEMDAYDLKRGRRSRVVAVR
jgi:hypothetical protein